MTFHPAPRKMPSSSWMILPLPRTGPSSRWRLQLMTQVRLSSFSRPARLIAPRLSGSSHSPSPRNAQTRTSSVVRQAAVAQVAVVPGVVDRHDRAEAHAHGRVLPEVRHEPRVRVARQSAAGVQFLAEVLELASRRAGPRRTRGRTCRGWRGPGRRRRRRGASRCDRGRSG